MSAVIPGGELFNALRRDLGIEGHTGLVLERRWNEDRHGRALSDVVADCRLSRPWLIGSNGDGVVITVEQANGA